MCISRTVRFKYTFYQVTQMNHEYFFPSNHDLLLFLCVYQRGVCRRLDPGRLARAGTVQLSLFAAAKGWAGHGGAG